MAKKVIKKSVKKVAAKKSSAKKVGEKSFQVDSQTIVSTSTVRRKVAADLTLKTK
jgi:hypothetical protein